MSFQMWTRPVLAFALVAAALAQDPAVTTPEFTIGTGTKVPLSLINSVSTKHSAEGDRVYLETVFPVLVNGRIVVPVGSYVAGTVTQLKKPGRTKGRGELYVRFDSLTLPNGVTRDFHARIGSMDGNTRNELDRTEGVVKAKEIRRATHARSEKQPLPEPASESLPEEPGAEAMAWEQASELPLEPRQV